MLSVLQSFMLVGPLAKMLLALCMLVIGVMTLNTDLPPFIILPSIDARVRRMPMIVMRLGSLLGWTWNYSCTLCLVLDSSVIATVAWAAMCIHFSETLAEYFSLLATLVPILVTLSLSARCFYVVAATPFLNLETTVRDSVPEDDDSACESLAMPSTSRLAEIARID